MTLALTGCVLISLIVSFIATGLARRVGDRLAAHDGQGVAGQVKAEIRRIPNTGGIGIALTLIIMLAGVGLAAQFWPKATSEVDTLGQLAFGVRENLKLLLAFLVGLVVLHGMGVIDDRRPMDWKPKLLAMLIVPAAVAWTSQTRVLWLLDPYVGGPWLSVIVTTIWFVVVMNAMNFLDNMDGLAGGLGAVIAAGLLAVALLNGQWIIAFGAGTLLGSTLGFLPHNFPRARVFMGDGGSLAIGYTIAFLTVRLNYAEMETGGSQWHLLFVPLVLLAIPLYDFVSVVLIRLSQGKSPFVGDLQHFSHRMARRGLGKTGAVVAIWILAAITGTGAVVMSRSTPWQASLIAAQTLAVLGLIVYLERGVPERSS